MPYVFLAIILAQIVMVLYPVIAQIVGKNLYFIDNYLFWALLMVHAIVLADLEMT